MVAVDTSSLPLPSERDQLRTLFELRWRLFTHSMRNTDSTVAFVFFLAGRILVFGFAAAAGAGSGFAAYFGYRQHTSALLTALTAIFIAWQSLSLLRGTTPRGVETELLRFPFRFRTYALLWLSSGLFEGGTILGTFACLGVLAGLLLAGAAFVPAVCAPLLFLLCNFVLSRAMYLRLNRLLAKRRTRELVLILTSMLGLFPRVLQTNRHAIDPLMRFHLPHALHIVPQVMPPYLALHTLDGGTPWLALAGLVLWNAVLIADLGYGLRRAFRGELLQESAAASVPARLRPEIKAARRTSGTSHPALIVARMEWTRLRHSGTALYQVFSPLLFVVIFGARMVSRSHGAWMLPAAAAYMGLQLQSMNAFGGDEKGVQCFLLMPVPLRSILMGKNLYAALTYAVQIASVALLILLVAHRLEPAAVLFTVLWAGCYCAVCFGLGHQRSLRAPVYTPLAAERVTFRTNSRARRGGGWMMLLMMFGVGFLGLIIVSAALWLKHPALAPAAMLPFTVAGAWFYRRSLRDPALNGDILAAEPLMAIIARA